MPKLLATMSTVPGWTKSVVCRMLHRPACRLHAQVMHNECAMESPAHNHAKRQAVEAAVRLTQYTAGTASVGPPGCGELPRPGTGPSGEAGACDPSSGLNGGSPPPGGGDVGGRLGCWGEGEGGSWGASGGSWMGWAGWAGGTGTTGCTVGVWRPGMSGRTGRPPIWRGGGRMRVGDGEGGRAGDGLGEAATPAVVQGEEEEESQRC